MTPAEFGAYLRLLLVHYRMGEGGIPADEKQLARLCGANAKVWNTIRATVMDKFKQGDPAPDGTPRLVHPRVKMEIQTRLSTVSNRRDNALKRWGAYHAKASDLHEVCNANHNPKGGNTPPCPPLFSGDNSPSPEKNINKHNDLSPKHPVDNPVDNRESPAIQPSEGGREGLKKIKGEGSDHHHAASQPFRVSHHLDDRDVEQARRFAPEWDIYALMHRYDQAIADGSRSMPDRPAAAFLGWVKAFTKGKPPGRN